MGFDPAKAWDSLWEPVPPIVWARPAVSIGGSAGVASAKPPSSHGKVRSSSRPGLRVTCDRLTATRVRAAPVMRPQWGKANEGAA